MSLFSIDHAIGIARDLADRISLRLSNGSGLNSVRQASTTSASAAGAGWPMLFVSHGGAEAEGDSVIAIRIENINPGSIDIFGNATLPFTPHQMEVAYELNSAGKPIPANKDLVAVLHEASRPGMVMVQKEIANGTAVTEASVEAASPLQTLADIDWADQGNT